VTAGPVVVDLQALQSPDHRGRGISRYAYELAVALERRHPELVGRYLLNPDLPPPADLGPLLGSGKVDYSGVPDSARVLHALSPFELGVPIDRVWPRWAHARGLRFCATVYDLIPLERPDVYLEHVRQRLLYTARLEVLRAADALVTISPSTSRSLVSNLGIDPRKVHMVGAATSSWFVPAESAEQAHSLAAKAVQGLESRFVLYPGGSDPRKNVEALVVAFARLPEALRSSRQLVIVGNLPPLMVNHLLHVARREGIAGRVICAGQVTDEVMVRLYQATELLCFPSLLEGYGLPVAEAMACGAVAIASDVEPLRDLVAPEARFDPESTAAITASMERALSDEAFREAARRHAHSSVTTWADVADRTAGVYEALLSRPGRPWRPRRRRVAIVSPFPPVPSGIARYSFRLVEELAALGELDIDCFADGLDRADASPKVPAGLAVFDARAFLNVEAATAGYDDVVYVLGNGEFHTGALASLRRREGIVLAHDVRLSGLYKFSAHLRAAVPGGVAGAIRSTYGPLLPEGVGAAGEVSPLETELYGLLMSREVMGRCELFLVTSHAAARLARIEGGPELASRVAVAGFATELPKPVEAGFPFITGIEPTSRVLASFGIVDPIKQPHKLLRALAMLGDRYPDLVLALVGPVSHDLARELRELAGALGLQGRVVVTGRVEDDAYLAWLERAELAVQLRASFSGEASAATGDCLAGAVPMIVSDLGWMGDLPDDVVSKVPAGASPEELAQACAALLDDTSRRQKLGGNARRYAEMHSFASAARALSEILRDRSRATPVAAQAR
jgi:glycosyltransferase involved in cell wall biosynthesis